MVASSVLELSCLQTNTQNILLRIRARQRAISRSTPMAAESPTGRTIQSWPFWDYRQNPATGRDLTPPFSSADYPCGIGSIAQSRYTYQYPHGYSAEEKYLASGRRRTRTVYTDRSGYRDNRADVITDLDGQIDYRGSTNPLRTSYVTQYGVSIKRKKTT